MHMKRFATYNCGMLFSIVDAMAVVVLERCV